MGAAIAIHHAQLWISMHARGSHMVPEEIQLPVAQASMQLLLDVPSIQSELLRSDPQSTTVAPPILVRQTKVQHDTGLTEAIAVG